MNSASSLPTRPNTKPPPLPKARALTVVPPPAPIEDAEDDLDITAVAKAPPEVLREARSDVRELRVPRPAAPRPSSVPTPNEGVVKRSGPPPLPPSAVAPAVSPVPAATSAPAPAPATAPRLEAASELDIMKPRAFLVARTAWFFGAFIMTDVFRWAVERLSHGRAWLAAEWRHAAIRAQAQRR